MPDISFKRLPQDWIDAIAVAHKRAGQSRLAWLRAAVKEKLPKKVSKKLSVPPDGRGGPKKVK